MNIRILFFLRGGEFFYKQETHLGNELYGFFKDKSFLFTQYIFKRKVELGK